ncbi:nitrosoguanidine resistance protein SNG1 [Purpureocillium lavendulum]|uniref:Nitrosoguanidine resistance protein SNG1 n=1 Tax=Purpureocillium lavendulum TaxID=1247861 RepID=A0AB34FLQ4_9HYPO|nr:nitrosoguanidine resistance protein SNG1 [Purpureocillium lavendulum]
MNDGAQGHSQHLPARMATRLPLSHPEVKTYRIKFLKAAALNFVLIVVLFFSLFCYLFGSLYQQESRVHSLTVLWVDYDGGGIVGDAVRQAYASLQSSGFPTLIERAVSDFPTVASLREAVCNTDYWAALYTTQGASAALAEAISGGTSSPYNASDVLSFIWNEARYPTVVDSLIAGSLETLSQAARVAYYSLNGTAAIATLPPGDSAAVAAFTNPWTLTSYNIQPTTQGPRAVYNTIVIVLVLIQDFFYLAIINGLYGQFKIYTRISPVRIVLVRDAISTVFTMTGALLLTCAIWAFRVDWDVSGTQFALNWLVMWLFAHVNFLTLDVFTIWIPPQYVSMALISWVVLNVTSIILPFDLSSPFYRWAYAMPAHEAYEALTDVWTDGCNPHLYYALPILFAYEVSGLVWTTLGVFRRCHCAALTEESAQEAMRLRVEAALVLEREHDRRLSVASRRRSRKEGDDEKGEPSMPTPAAGHLDDQETTNDTDEADRREAEHEMEELGEEINRMETRASKLANFGPSFQLVGTDND